MSTLETDHQIPWKKLLPILLARISDAITWCFCFSFLPSMLASFGLSVSDVALYTGVAESCMIVRNRMLFALSFQCVEAIVALPVAKLSDRIGRKPVVIIGLASLSVCTACMGFSKSVWQVILWRLLMGLNGTLVSRVMCMEITHPGNRTQTFAVFAPTYMVVLIVGVSVGNAIGGYLALPQDRIPVLGGMRLFQTYPYLLPCLVAASIPFVSIPISLRSLPETVKRQSRTLATSDGHRVPGPTTLDAVRQPGVLRLLTAFAVFQVVESGSMAAMTLTLTLPVEEEGLGYAVSTAGTILLGQALVYVTMVPLLVPYLVQRCGIKGAIILLMCAWPVAAVQFPIATWLAKLNSGLLAVVVGSLVCIRNVGCGPWPLFDVLTADLSKPELLALTNALNMIAWSVGRMIGPIAFGAIFARAIQSEPGTAGRLSVWIVVFVAALTPVMAVCKLKEPTKEDIEEAQGLLDGRVSDRL